MFRQSARSAISGSQAALRISVVPWASTAASMACSVAPTETGKLDLRALQAPRRLGVDIALVQVDLRAQRLQRLQEQVDRPRADGAAAGQRDRASPMRASSGASTQNLARIFATSS